MRRVFLLVCLAALLRAQVEEVSAAEDEAQLLAELAASSSSITNSTSTSNTANDLIANATTHITKIQPPWIDRNKFDVQAITGLFPADGKTFTEFAFGEFVGADPVQSYQVFGVRTSRWCFLRFLGPDALEKKFFFECLVRERGDPVFLRVVNAFCPFPPITPTLSPVEETCRMFYRRGKDTVQSLLGAVGNVDAQAIIECYIQAVVTTKTADVETMCSKEAFVEGWEALSGKQADELVQSYNYDPSKGYNQTLTGATTETAQTVGKTLARVPRQTARPATFLARRIARKEAAEQAKPAVVPKPEVHAKPEVAAKPEAAKPQTGTKPEATGEKPETKTVTPVKPAAKLAMKQALAK